jgi:hypothetical protein
MPVIQLRQRRKHAAGVSESQCALDAQATYKERAITDAPTKAAHLHDKTVYLIETLYVHYADSI